MIDLDVDQVPIEQLPALIAQLAEMAAQAWMRLQPHAGAHDGDDCDCLDAQGVAGLLKCSVDLVRERGERWGIAKVLARDSRGRATRVTYPKAKVRAYLSADTGSDWRTR